MATELPPAPGMGAERMGMTWFTGVLMSDTVYQPRHRSTRQSGGDIDQLDGTLQGNLPGPQSMTVIANSAAGTSAITADHPVQRFLDQMTVGEVRRILEGCALDDLTRVVPELVQLIAHSSHTPATLTRAWSEFEEATRDVYALHLRIRNWSAFFKRDELGTHPDEDALSIMLGYADDAWRLITRGPWGASAAGAARAPASRTR